MKLIYSYFKMFALSFNPLSFIYGIRYWLIRLLCFTSGWHAGQNPKVSVQRRWQEHSGSVRGRAASLSPLRHWRLIWRKIWYPQLWRKQSMMWTKYYVSLWWHVVYLYMNSGSILKAQRLSDYIGTTKHTSYSGISGYCYYKHITSKRQLRDSLQEWQ